MKNKGFTLIEVLVAMGITTLLVAPIAWILINGFRNNAIVWEQLKTQTEGRRVLQQVVDVVRKAEQSSLGAYQIEKAESYDLIVFANVDADSLREKVRFWIDNKTLKKTVIKPTGNPLAYSGAGITTELAHDVLNQTSSTPLFYYYNQNYAGTGSALSLPVSIPDIRVIRVSLGLEKSPTASPAPLWVESVVSVRSLKSN